MAGVEAIGLALGILPLLISAIEHYDEVLRPFSRYRGFASKAQRFIDELETERTIFRTECQLLLAVVAGPKIAAEMLRDCHHSSWHDDAVRSRLIGKLGVLGAECTSLICKIENKLCDIGQKSEQLGTVIAQEKKGNATQDKNWRRRVATKLKFSFSEPGLRQLIKDLRILNKTFLILSNQAARLDSHYDVSPQQNRNPFGIYIANHEILDKFQRIQHASQILHDALSRACNIHPEHLVQLCSLAKYTSDGPGISKTRFTLAFSRAESPGDASLAIDTMMSKQSTTPYEMTWLEIESVTSNHGKLREDRYAKDDERPPPNDISWRPDKEKSVATPSADIATSSTSLLQFNTASSEPKSHQSLCMHLSLISAGSAGSHVYTLKQIRGCKHIVHGPVSLSASRSSMSLAQLITHSPGEKSSNEMPQYQRLSHAKALALAVLQFHTTPWLSGSWKSDNVFFCGSSEGGSQQPQGDAVPHLNATVAPAKSLARPRSSITTPSTLPASVVPNLLLFDLGVMLLELAYNAPFQALRQQHASLNSANTTVADFTAALSLADQVGVFLGAGFAAIVKKCLRCDFGCGNSLDHPGLQARLYKDVVCKLERLEEGFRKLQLND